MYFLVLVIKLLTIFFSNLIYLIIMKFVEKEDFRSFLNYARRMNQVKFAQKVDNYVTKTFQSRALSKEQIYSMPMKKILPIIKETKSLKNEYSNYKYKKSCLIKELNTI